MSDRLKLAVENGHVVLPEGEVLVFPRENSDLSVFDRTRTRLSNRSAANTTRCAQEGWSNGAPMSEWTGAVVFLPRAKDAQRATLRFVRDLMPGPIIVDGDKTDGIEAIYRDLKARAEVTDPWSKAHGKVFTVTGGSFDDWPWPEPFQSSDGWWRAPGVFSADGVDPASNFLADNLPDDLSGAVVDLGAGWGFLSRSVLDRKGVTSVDLVEDDALALRAAERNIKDDRAAFHWADALTWQPPEKVDHVVTNPPFHTGRKAEPKLGQAFIVAAAGMLKPKGALWLVANRHLPYEKTLQDAFRTVTLHAETPSFKIFHATSPKRRKA